MQADAELVSLALQGDVEAFGTLIERYERAVLAIAFQVLADREAARDVAQEALWKAYQKLESLRNGDEFGTWLLRIARNHALSETRRRRRLPRLQTLDESLYSVDQGQPSLLQVAVLEAVVRLPHEERQVVMMRFFEFLSVADIATCLHRPLGTVTKQLSRAYGHLRESLSEMEELGLADVKTND